MAGGGGELWLVSVPGNPEPSNSWEEITDWEIADWEMVDWEKTLLKSVLLSSNV